VPAAGQLLIKVHASSVNPAEWYGTTGQPYLVRLMNGLGAPERPRIGFDMAGVVEAVAPDVTSFKPGDEVFGGVGGAFGEYVLGREKGAIVKKPENMSFEEAAGIPIAAITALQGLRDSGHLAAGQKVLVNGASGGVGQYAVQIAKALGAEVTGVCSTRNVDMVSSLGADHVIDYTREDFTAKDGRYDVILDNVGNHDFTDLAGVMSPKGTIVVVGGSKKGPFLGPIKRVAWSKIVGHFIDPTITFFIARVNAPDLEWLANLAREGKLRTVIDRRYPLAETGAALEYLGGGHARGKVIIDVN
jgi:NADPH:quinone reductase-like Zn-dependent oxidoreductase